MEDVKSKAQSQGQNSQIMPENVEGFQKRVKEILNLIKEDEDRKKSMKKQVTELSRMYGELTERYARNVPVKNDVPKETETKVKKISTLEKEVVALKKQVQKLTDDNAILESEKANVPDLKRMISESNRKIEITGKVIEASRKQVKTADEENSKLKRQMSTKVLYLTRMMDAIENQYDETVKLGLVEIAKRDEQIAELNSQIDLMKNSQAAEVDGCNTEISKIKEELCSEDFDLIRKMESMENQFEEKVKLGLAEIAKRDEQIAELKTQIDLMKNSDVVEEDIEKLKKKLEKWYEIEEVDL